MLNVCSNPLPPCGGGLGWGVIAGEMRDDDVVDALDIAEHLIVPEAQHAEPLPLQPRRPRIVLREPTVMLPAIDLDDEPPIEADEVDDVATDRHLSAETMTVDLLEAELRPQALFRFRRIAAELTGVGRGHD